MPKYDINAYRETFYAFEIEADDVDSAIEKMRVIEASDEIESYAYEKRELEIDEINELEDENE
jgi:hypothetical protein